MVTGTRLRFMRTSCMTKSYRHQLITSMRHDSQWACRLPSPSIRRRMPAMTPEAYVIGSIVFSVIFVASLYGLHGSDPIDQILRCPRCGAEMQSVGTSAPGWVIHVVSPPLVLRCLQCGYEERSWV